MTSKPSTSQVAAPPNKHIILIDFENLQPTSLAPLRAGHFTIKLFYGARQTKNLLSLTEELVNYKYDAELIQIQGAGPNALDFHIAYYVGRLSAQIPESVFYIISADKGFDPLLKHLKEKGVTCHRVPTTDAVAGLTTKPLPRPADRARKVADAILTLTRDFPRNRNALLGTINSRLQPKPTPELVAQVMHHLELAGWVIPAVGPIDRKTSRIPLQSPSP